MTFRPAAGDAGPRVVLLESPAGGLLTVRSVELDQPVVDVRHDTAAAPVQRVTVSLGRGVVPPRSCTAGIEVTHPAGTSTVRVPVRIE